jgi:hypothetical protein
MREYEQRTRQLDPGEYSFAPAMEAPAQAGPQQQPATAGSVRE